MAQEDCLVGAAEFRGRNIATNGDTQFEFGAAFREEVDATGDNRLTGSCETLRKACPAVTGAWLEKLRERAVDGELRRRDGAGRAGVRESGTEFRDL